MTALQQIIKEAKIIKKKYPNKKWMDCVKQASAIYKSKHKTVKKKAVKKIVKKKVGSAKRIGVIKKKRPSEKTVLKSIKRAVNVQKKHMSIGNVKFYI